MINWPTWRRKRLNPRGVSAAQERDAGGSDEHDPDDEAHEAEGWPSTTIGESDREDGCGEQTNSSRRRGRRDPAGDDTDRRCGGAESDERDRDGSQVQTKRGRVQRPHRLNGGWGTGQLLRFRSQRQPVAGWRWGAWAVGSVVGVLFGLIDFLQHEGSGESESAKVLDIAMPVLTAALSVLQLGLYVGEFVEQGEHDVAQAWTSPSVLVERSQASSNRWRRSAPWRSLSWPESRSSLDWKLAA